MFEPTIDVNAIVDPTCKIWGNATVRAGASIGARTIIGSGAYIDSGVIVGSDCKVQNSAQIYFPAIIQDGVFIGPLVTLTNDKNPRAINSDGSIKSTNDWKPVGVTVESGASIGANSVCVAPLHIGQWAMVAAGSVVINDVKSHQLVGGNPAKHLDWVGKSGFRLNELADGTLGCPETKEIYLFDEHDNLSLQVTRD